MAVAGELLYDNPASLPVLVVQGQHLEGMVSNWDVLTKIAVNLLAAKPGADSATSSSDHGEE